MLEPGAWGGYQKTNMKKAEHELRVRHLRLASRGRGFEAPCGRRMGEVGQRRSTTAWDAGEITELPG